MTDYARDELGRPISEDGNWVWDGTTWAARTAPEPEPVADPVAVEVEEPEPVRDEPVLVDYFPQHAEPEPVHEREPEHADVLVQGEPVPDFFLNAGPVDPTVPESAPAAASLQAPPVLDFRAARPVDDDDEADVFVAPTPQAARATSYASPSVSYAGDDEMSLARLAATTAGVVLALGGALMLGVAVATILIVRAFQKAMETAMTTGNADALSSTGPTSGSGTTVLIYGISFAVATLAAFSVLYAAKVPKAIIGAAAIVVLSFLAFYAIDRSGVEMQSWTGIALLPLVPAISTAGFIKWATR